MKQKEKQKKKQKKNKTGKRVRPITTQHKMTSRLGT